METNIEVVKAYLQSLGPTANQFWASFDSYFDDKTVWENVGLARTVGREEAIAFAKAFPLEFDHMRVDDLKIAACGDVVLTERLDHFCDGQGNILLTIPVAGSFRVEGEIIREWRDYFDVPGLMKKFEVQAPAA